MIKKLGFTSLVVVFGFFILITNVHASGEGQPTVKIISPNGGEVLNVGDTYRITWESSSNVDKVSVGYSFGEGSLNWIVNNTPNNNYYDWKVYIGNHVMPANVKIYIIAYNTGTGSITDYSDDFFTVKGNVVSTPPDTTTNNSNTILPAQTSVETMPESNSIDANMIKLNGFYEYAGANGSGWFEYGTTANLGNKIMASCQQIAYGHYYMCADIPVLGNTTYYYRAAVNDSTGTFYGSILNFTTPALDTTNKNNSPISNTVIQGISTTSVTGISVSAVQNITTSVTVNDIINLQNVLIQNNLLSADDATGNFGKLTKAALLKWQKANGLNPDGILSPKTLDLINTIISKKTAVVSSPIKKNSEPIIQNTKPVQQNINNAPAKKGFWHSLWCFFRISKDCQCAIK